MSFDLHFVRNGVVFDYSGEVTSYDVLQSNKEVYGREHFDELRFELVNFLKAREISFSKHDVRMIAAMDKAAAISNPRIKVALVAERSDVNQLLRLYEHESHQSPWTVEVFASMDQAIEWLGIDPLLVAH